MKKLLLIFLLFGTLSARELTSEESEAAQERFNSLSAYFKDQCTLGICEKMHIEFMQQTTDDFFSEKVKRISAEVWDNLLKTNEYEEIKEDFKEQARWHPGAFLKLNNQFKEQIKTLRSETQLNELEQFNVMQIVIALLYLNLLK